MQDKFMTALNNVKSSMEMTHWTDSFHDDEILFASNYTDAFVDAWSMVHGMGLSWPTQYWKIKKRFGIFDIEIAPNGIAVAQLRALHRKNIEKFLFSINPSKIQPDKVERVILYQKEFIDFAYSQTYTESDAKSIEFYLTPAGRKQLAGDVLQLKNQGIVNHLSAIFEHLLSSEQLGECELQASDMLLDMIEIVSKNQHKLRGNAA
ncbi:phage antirepressor N-terminal domain-containing protein [bacterium]|nr:phage antirepressor N-terminal domain-containing protein [bacterium]